MTFLALRRDPRDFLTMCCCMLRILYAYKFYQLRYLNLIVSVTSYCRTQKNDVFYVPPQGAILTASSQALRILAASYEIVCIATLCYRHTACLASVLKARLALRCFRGLVVSLSIRWSQGSALKCTGTKPARTRIRGFRLSQFI